MVGWLLMAPPVKDGRLQMDVPIKRWRQLSAYDTAAACERGTADATAMAQEKRDDLLINALDGAGCGPSGPGADRIPGHPARAATDWRPILRAPGRPRRCLGGVAVDGVRLLPARTPGGHGRSGVAARGLRPRECGRHHRGPCAGARGARHG